MSNWTPGPWRVEAQSISQGRAWRWGVHHSNEATDDNDIIGWEIDDKADAELIALAPEMAEAVLVPHGDCEDEFGVMCSRPEDQANWPQTCSKHDAQYSAKHETIRKLRAIGEDNE